ncbi:type II toxin-antitoxin system HicB family antitoxin [Acaricomes phytoseiuli]|uniref:type II toxin-antitoxin system HicB family antitoxin n=1 Tax=Acaricomes phytoseiuli TaxID=291968 RepID=UPI00035C534C|nr:toxin-antitoxin system HicB family antitoxin [Acaricomes phytoseiuli]
MNWQQYTYRVAWHPEDGEFVATVAEFPSLSWLAETSTEAFEGIQVLARDVVKDMEDAGEQVPAPFSLRPYSGRIPIRTTPEVHRRLSIEAAEQNVSLSRYIKSKIGA